LMYVDMSLLDLILKLVADYTDVAEADDADAQHLTACEFYIEKYYVEAKGVEDSDVVEDSYDSRVRKLVGDGHEVLSDHVGEGSSHYVQPPHVVKREGPNDRVERVV